MPRYGKDARYVLYSRVYTQLYLRRFISTATLPEERSENFRFISRGCRQRDSRVFLGTFILKETTPFIGYSWINNEFSISYFLVRFRRRLCDHVQTNRPVYSTFQFHSSPASPGSNIRALYSMLRNTTITMNNNPINLNTKKYSQTKSFSRKVRVSSKSIPK